MDNINDILAKVNRNDGTTVPPGYFDDFKKRMAESLPDRPELFGAPAGPRSPWMRWRPYVYMAAMFGGIWCMLKLFTMITSMGTMSLDNNPVIAEALANDDFVNEYVISDLNQWDYYDELMEDGIAPDSLMAIADTAAVAPLPN